MHARLGGKRQARAPHGTGTGTPSSGYPHRSLAPIPVRHASVDTATQRPTALQGDTRRDREETARLAETSQLAGRFRRVWQVMGSNHRRLSRRFYSPPAPPESPPADQRGRHSRRDFGPPPSAMRPCAPGFGVRAVDGPSRNRPRTATDQPTDGAGGSGYADRSRPDSRSDLPFQDACSMSPSPSSPGVFLGVLGAEGLGDALVGGGRLAVDAVGVDLQQDRDAMPAGASGRKPPGTPATRRSPPRSSAAGHPQFRALRPGWRAAGRERLAFPGAARPWIRDDGRSAPPAASSPAPARPAHAAELGGLFRGYA